MMLEEEKNTTQAIIPQHIQDAFRSVSLFSQPALDAIESINRSINFAQEPWLSVMKSVEQAQKMTELSGLSQMVKTAQQFADQLTEQNKQFASLLQSDFLNEDRRVFIAPPVRRGLTLEDAEWMIDKISERISKDRQPEMIRLLIDTKNKKLFNAANTKDAYVYRSENRVRLLLSLKHDFTKTSELAFLAGYDVRTLETTIQKINELAKTKFGLNFKLIVGNPGHGYKLSSRCIVALADDPMASDA